MTPPTLRPVTTIYRDIGVGVVTRFIEIDQLGGFSFRQFAVFNSLRDLATETVMQQSSFITRPSRSFADLEVSSVKKKLKDKGFARGVNRDEVTQGAAELGVPLDEHIAFVIQALRPVESDLRLGGSG